MTASTASTSLTDTDRRKADRARKLAACIGSSADLCAFLDTDDLTGLYAQAFGAAAVMLDDLAAIVERLTAEAAECGECANRLSPRITE